MAKRMNAKRPRNYAATEATLINVRKLAREVKALVVRVEELEVSVRGLETPALPVPESVHDDPLSES